MTSKSIDEVEIELIETAWEYRYRPYDFVLWAFPWKEKGTMLANYARPRKWQEEALLAIQEELLKREEAGDEVDLGVIKDATVAGRGVGKGAYCAFSQPASKNLSRNRYGNGQQGPLLSSILKATRQIRI